MEFSRFTGIDYLRPIVTKSDDFYSRFFLDLTSSNRLRGKPNYIGFLYDIPVAQFAHHKIVIGYWND